MKSVLKITLVILFFIAHAAPAQQDALTIDSGGAVTVAKGLAVNGNVGIGISRPGARLTIRNNSTDPGTSSAGKALFVSGVFGPGETRDGGIEFLHDNLTQGIGFGYNTIYASGSNPSQNLNLIARGSGNITLNSYGGATGNIGIGTTAPQAKLDVAGDIRANGTIRAGANAVLGTGIAAGYYQDANNGAYRAFPNGSAYYFQSFQGAGTTMFIGLQGTYGGRVGIGTTTPSVPLEVRSSMRYDLGGNFWFAFKNESRIAAGGAHLNNISIKTAFGIQTEYGFYVTSDRRIKRALRLSDNALDLDILTRLRPTDYGYIDVAHYGDQRRKGLIAQEVESVFPQAVSKGTGVVPDIYKPAEVHDGWVGLSTDLRKGDRVKLIDSKSEGVYEVTEVEKDRFRANYSPGGDKVFVFGREVNDFRTVDYDAVAVLNVSATQEIKKQMDAEVEALKADNAKLRARLDALEKRLISGEESAARTASVQTANTAK
ncbi:MAG TPA: tail fiber domain-containing protein [Bryobacteraceae bacterium]|jgi:hypothetical protein|nr:tail fiber domain-containing protein [Bryobacteraceae bacterium]